MDDFMDKLKEFLEQKMRTSSEDRRDAYQAIQWFILDYELKEDLGCKE